MKCEKLNCCKLNLHNSAPIIFSLTLKLASRSFVYLLKFSVSELVPMLADSDVYCITQMHSTVNDYNIITLNIIKLQLSEL